MSEWQMKTLTGISVPTGAVECAPPPPRPWCREFATYWFYIGWAAALTAGVADEEELIAMDRSFVWK